MVLCVGAVLLTAATALSSAPAAAKPDVAAVATFWRHLVTAQNNAESLTASVPVAEKADRVLEYLHGCTELCGVCGYDVHAALDADDTNIALTITKGTVDAATAAAVCETSDAEAISRDDALDKLLDWFTAALIAMGDTEGDEEEAEDSPFVKMGRCLLHTQETSVSYGSTLQEQHLEMWELVAKSPYLVDGEKGGASLFVAPTFTNFEAFDDFTWLVRSGLRALVNPKLDISVYHPLHPRTSARSPVPAMHMFLDTDELFIEGDGSINQLFQDLQ